ncbi:MAG: hypothetical protein KGK07_06345 [Chloroflexota bacterium]|nr:hypothetical protein [Chloroflexota bacterium]
MSFRLGSAVIELSTSDAKLDAGLAAAKQKVTAAAGAIQQKADLSAALGRFFSGAAVGAAIQGLGEVVKVARAAQVSEAQLAQAVRTTGLDWERNAKAVDAVLASRRRLAFSDNDLRGSLAILVEETGSLTEALARQQVAADLSRGTHLDLYTASKLVGKVTDENIRVLGRYGVVVQKGADAQAVMAAVEAKFGGQAEAYAATQQASADRIANSWERAQEQVGGAISSTLPLLASGAQLWTSFGHEGIVAAGAVAAFAKAGNGTVPVLTGLRSGITLLGGALKLLFLNPVGIAILAVAALAIGLKLLYDRSEGFRRIVNAVGDALRRVFGPILAWLGDRLGDLGKALGLVGDDAAGLGAEFEDGAAKAKGAIKSIAGELADLNEMFKPAGADQTEKFLQAIGADPALINAALDALYNTVGADQATRFKKVTDRAFKDLSTQFESSDAYKEAKENLKNALSMSEVDFSKLAASLGKSPAQYMAELKKNSADADRLLEHYQSQLEAAIKTARENGQTELHQAKLASNRVSDHIRDLHDLRAAWAEADSAAISYYQDVLRGGPPRATPMSPANRELQQGGDIGGRGLSVVVNQSLAYSGDTAAMAAGAAGEVVDAVTEAMRQQLRRIA